jgi:hypothetical protein
MTAGTDDDQALASQVEAGGVLVDVLVRNDLARAMASCSAMRG